MAHRDTPLTGGHKPSNLSAAHAPPHRQRSAGAPFVPVPVGVTAKLRPNTVIITMALVGVTTRHTLIKERPIGVIPPPQSAGEGRGPSDRRMTATTPCHKRRRQRVSWKCKEHTCANAHKYSDNKNKKGYIYIQQTPLLRL